MKEEVVAKMFRGDDHLIGAPAFHLMRIKGDHHLHIGRGCGSLRDGTCWEST
jgi:hypothetical protein